MRQKLVQMAGEISGSPAARKDKKRQHDEQQQFLDADAALGFHAFDGGIAFDGRFHGFQLRLLGGRFRIIFFGFFGVSHETP